jgi:hypothetical protein
VRWLGVLLFLAAFFVGPPALFLESWLGDVLFVSSVIILVVGLVLMLRPYTAREAAGGTLKKDLVGTAVIVGALGGTVAVAAVLWRAFTS